MASIAGARVCLVILLVYPFNAGLLNPLLLLVAVPYFLMMAGDLRHCGYRRIDVLRIYGFNLILLPVNLSGVVRVDAAADHRGEERLQADAEGAQPHDGGRAVHPRPRWR